MKREYNYIFSSNGTPRRMNEIIPCPKCLATLQLAQMNQHLKTCAPTTLPWAEWERAQQT